MGAGFDSSEAKRYRGIGSRQRASTVALRFMQGWVLNSPCQRFLGLRKGNPAILHLRFQKQTRPYVIFSVQAKCVRSTWDSRQAGIAPPGVEEALPPPGVPGDVAVGFTRLVGGFPFGFPRTQEINHPLGGVPFGFPLMRPKKMASKRGSGR